MRCEYTAPGYLSDRSRSKAININDRLTEDLRSFLRQIVPNAIADEAVSIFAGGFRAIRRVARMWRTVCITFKGDRRRSDDRSMSPTPRRGISGMPLFEVVRMAGLLQTATQGLTEFQHCT